MSLRLESDWMWDFWHAREASRHQLVVLRAPRTSDDPDRRHLAATMGHAVSDDLTTWELLPQPIHRGEPGDWDDSATWTGSVIATDAGWGMLYTGTNREENSLVQRVGLVRSNDLIHWEKHSENPVLQADPRWYELLDLDAWHDQAWRDPYVVRDEEGTFHAFLTARAAKGPPEARGVIGHAISQDLEEWTILPPIEAPAGFGYMEIPQIIRIGHLWHLLFSAPAWAQGGRAGTLPVTGTFHAVSDRIEGPYGEVAPLFVDRDERLYGGKLIEVDGRLVCLAFRYLNKSGSFVGELIDPLPVDVKGERELVVETGSARAVP